MNKIKSFIVRLFVCFIVDKQKRHKVRIFLLNIRAVDFLYYINFKNLKVRQKSILLVEVNDCHGEILSGYAKYFIDLGFNVDVIMNSKVADMKPFSRIKSTKIKRFPVSFSLINNFLNDKKLKKYKHIVFTTSVYYGIKEIVGGKKMPARVLDLFAIIHSFKSLFLVEHDLRDVKRLGEEDFLKQNRLIVLGNFKKGVMVNPHYFGDVKINEKNKIVKIVIVGTIDKQRKNHNLISQITKELKANGLQFEFVVIGKGSLKIEQKYKDHISVLGQLDYGQMYNEVEKADFVLFALDEKNNEHLRYITTAVTGSSQLSYGFCTPAIIHKKFAGFYGFDKSNSIVYTNDIIFQIENCIKMKNIEYQKIQNNLQKLSCDIYMKSLKNLDKIL